MRVRNNACCSPSLLIMSSRRFLLCLALLVCLYPVLNRFLQIFAFRSYSQATPHIQAVINKCLSLQQEPGPPPDFLRRSHSDRYESDTRPVLIQGGRIWTGRNNGTQVIDGDVLMERGIIKRIGKLGWMNLGTDLQVIDVKGAWVTPGLVDVHSHIGDFPLPEPWRLRWQKFLAWYCSTLVAESRWAEHPWWNLPSGVSGRCHDFTHLAWFCRCHRCASSCVIQKASWSHFQEGKHLLLNYERRRRSLHHLC